MRTRRASWSSRGRATTPGEAQSQFLAGQVDKLYLARIAGHPPTDQFACDAPIGDDTTHLGARAIDDAGSAARTEFTVLRRFADGTSLVEARPITGRTNQIRVHLWHLGWPVCGDQAYLANRQLGETQTHDDLRPSAVLACAPHRVPPPAD